MIAIACALASAACWGTADFLGGSQSKRSAVVSVLVLNQFVGLLFATALVLAFGGAAPAAEDLLPAAAAALSGMVGLSCLYRGLATGTMSIVAPISATGAALPVLVGVATGDRPSSLQALGIAAAVVGVVLAAQEAIDDAHAARRARLAIVLALVAAVGFGGFFIGADAAADAGVIWTLFAIRACSFCFVGIAALVARARPVGRADVPTVALMGVLDTGANGLYALAATKGLLSVVAVLGSLYPLATVALARILLGERVRRIQEAGIAAALVGVALIAAG